MSEILQKSTCQGFQYIVIIACVAYIFSICFLSPPLHYIASGITIVLGFFILLKIRDNNVICDIKENANTLWLILVSWLFLLFSQSVQFVLGVSDSFSGLRSLFIYFVLSSFSIAVFVRLISKIFDKIIVISGLAIGACSCFCYCETLNRTGLFFNANVFAFLCFGLIIALLKITIQFFNEKSNWKILSLLSLFSVCAGLAFSGSRGGILALFIGITVGTLFFLKHISSIHKILSFSVIVLVSTISLLPNLAGDRFFENLKTYDNGSKAQMTTSILNGRENVYPITLKLIRKVSPLCGEMLGKLDFKKNYQEFRDINQVHPHNAFLTYYIFWGIPGILSFLFFYYGGIQVKVQTVFEKQLKYFFIIYLISTIIFGLFDSFLTRFTFILFSSFWSYFLSSLIFHKSIVQNKNIERL